MISRKRPTLQRSSSIGGPRSAKRKTVIRKFFEQMVTSTPSFSDPFIADENETKDSCLLKCSRRNSKKMIKFISNSSDSDEYHDFTDPDGILIRPNLEEAEKFISSLRIDKKSIAVHKEPPVLKPYVSLIPREEIEAIMIESQKLEEMINQDSIEESEHDEEIL
ncbi:hypothetical protein M9Y10_025464 [Tritrichomonas musculus]|uniref:Uncharacterized protein n=1 Tax=Tritrichomonas musculus TaxID=1915356 RepID=A0ABR2H8V4_9EUKA